MKNPKVAIVTTTFYGNNPEGILRKRLATDFLTGAVEKGYEVFLVDGGTDNGAFLASMNTMGVHCYGETQHGLSGSRREALGHSQEYADRYGIDYIIWTEPEKVDMIRHIPRLVEGIEANHAHIAVPFRKNMRQYPGAQRNSEQFGNQRHTDLGYMDMRGKPIDTFAGPKLWVRGVTPFFFVFGDDKISRAFGEMRLQEKQAKLKHQVEGDTRQFIYDEAAADFKRWDHMIQMPVCLINLMGGRIISVPIDYNHPIEQAEIEQANQAVWNPKRMGQLSALDEQFHFVKWAYEKGVFREGDIGKSLAGLLD